MIFKDLRPQVGQVWQMHQNYLAPPITGYIDGTPPVRPNLRKHDKILIKKIYHEGERVIIVHGAGEHAWLEISDLQIVAVPLD